ncbi:hypothetical protein L288_12695 [Sphingobium quisquiliarum P25]|uniref:DUF2924 domain-containing protein n=2 Tax=Sphingobium quisquiliarum TaxID=538379 RepID=T0GXS0_9SPHN|nr:hypothetical protein L288_12695 [Sphingobium quisquiliarum P25]
MRSSGLMSQTERQIAALAAMSSAALKAEWQRLTGTAPPRISPAMMRLALAWEWQARAHGGLSRQTSQKLAQLAGTKSRTAEARAGMRLVREWNGAAHVVTVGEDRVIRWNGREWRSLSEVARAITGTRWSGPAFFGLRQKAAA